MTKVGHWRIAEPKQRRSVYAPTDGLLYIAYQRWKEKMRRVYTVLINEANRLSSEGVHFMETCCRILGIE